MSDTSRRKFLAAAGIGAAGTVGLTGASASAAPATRNTDSAREPVVAFVEHPYADRVHLMVGEREIVVHDKGRMGHEGQRLQKCRKFCWPKHVPERVKAGCSLSQIGLLLWPRFPRPLHAGDSTQPF